MKHLHYTDYGLDDVRWAESALLTVWAALGDLTEDVVLIGGLVPRYICRPTERLAAVTMDAEFCAGTEPLATGAETFFRQQRVNDALDAARYVLKTRANP